jgi:glyoxylase-like metal-dependent hydrolase (beta-lactamase superfamily II)
MTTRIPFIRDFDPQYGTLVRLGTHIRRLVAHNPNPFSAWGTNVYVIGQGEVSIIDPGPNNDTYFETLIRALGQERVSRVFVTHHHLDHSPMAARLAAHYGCKTYGYGTPTFPPYGGEVRMEAGDDMAFIPDITLTDGQVFDGPDYHIEAIHTPGHTSNHVCYAVLEDNGLVCGDHVMAWSTSVISPPDGDMGDYLASLQKVQERNFAVLWPGHGAPIPKPTDFIDAYIAHRHDRNAQILDQLAQGQYNIKAMVPRLYADVDVRLHPAACHSVLAHLIHMVKTGKVVCKDAPGLDSQYRLS